MPRLGSPGTVWRNPARALAGASVGRVRQLAPPQGVESSNKHSEFFQRTPNRVAAPIGTIDPHHEPIDSHDRHHPSPRSRSRLAQLPNRTAAKHLRGSRLPDRRCVQHSDLGCHRCDRGGHTRLRALPRWTLGRHVCVLIGAASSASRDGVDVRSGSRIRARRRHGRSPHRRRQPCHPSAPRRGRGSATPVSTRAGRHDGSCIHRRVRP